MLKFAAGLRLAAVATALAFTHPALAAEKESSVRATVEYLASPKLAGRLTGTPGERKGAKYLVKKLKAAGVKPLPGRKDYLEPFEYTSGVNDAGTSLVLKDSKGETTFAHTNSDSTPVQALSFSDSATVTGPVVFAGYGISTNQESGYAYDSFEGLDLKDKIVVVFRYYPENLSQDKRLVLAARASELRTKAQNARDRGAKALLVTSGPAYAPGADIVPLTFDSAVAGSSIVAASISTETATKLFAAAGKTKEELEVLQRRLDGGDPAAKGFDLTGVTVTLDTKLTREKSTGHNVLGYLPANGPAPVDEWVGIGGHYDHLGDGHNVATSLAKDTEKGKPHVGADDNASGVAASLAAIEQLRGAKLNRPVFVAFWSGEEIGLLGSNAFVKEKVVPTDRISAYINLDMVGRSKDNKLAVQGVGSSPDWEKLVASANAGIDLKLTSTKDPYTPSDSTAFYLAGIPAVHLFTGSHEDYHRPSDTPDKINYPGLATIAKFTAALAEATANAPARVTYAKVERSSGGRMGGTRSGVRVFTGTIPDYTAEAKGLLLSGTIEGSPASVAGLKEGDLIIEFAGRKIANIYDYMGVLEGVKVGESVKVVYTRDGKNYDTTLIPGTRK